MKPKNILIICDESDIQLISESFQQYPVYNITIHTAEEILEKSVQEYLMEQIHFIKENPDVYDGVVGTHDSSAVFAAVICEETGKIGTPVRSIINCQNKYISRKIQSEFTPENTPRFCLDMDYLVDLSSFAPVFVKPVRSNVSYLSKVLYSPDELKELIHEKAGEIAEYNQYFIDSLAVCSTSPGRMNLDTCNNFLCEEIITGDQVTVDGFVVDGNVSIYGITKAVFYDDAISFSHHEFPYELPFEFEARLRAVIFELIRALELNNTCFNIELKINQDTGEIKIIEVNSRIAFQFAKSIEAVRGFDPLHILCDIAVGEKPLYTRDFKGDYKYCFNFELRKFSDKKILKTPNPVDFDKIKTLYPEVKIRNLISEDTMLSDYKHNPESFRYCIIDIPGNSREEIFEKLDEVKSHLGYIFEDSE